MPEDNEPSLAKLRDLQMMLQPGGMERTENECQELLSKAGLKMTKIYSTKSFIDIIEAVPIQTLPCQSNSQLREVN